MLDSANPTNKSECEGCKAVRVCVDLVTWTQKKTSSMCVCLDVAHSHSDEAS